MCIAINQTAYTDSFIHSIGTCRMRQNFAVLRSFFHSSLLCNFSCQTSPTTIFPSSPTSSCHLFLGLPLSLVVHKFIYNTLLGILFPSILCTCPNQHNLFKLIVFIIVGFNTYILTYLLTPWCRVLLEKLNGLQLVKKFPAFQGTRRFITALTSVRHLSLSWASPI